MECFGGTDTGLVDDVGLMVGVKRNGMYYLIQMELEQLAFAECDTMYWCYLLRLSYFQACSWDTQGMSLR